MRIAYFSPLPPAASGIADYSAELLPHLSEGAEIELFVDPNRSVDPSLAQRYPIHPIATFPERQATSSFDAALYQMGNDVRFHGAIYEMLQREPGIVVLHEVVLHHALAGLYLRRDETERYVDLVRQIYGPGGVAVAQRVIDGEPIDLCAFPLLEPVLEAGRGFIVHSQHAARAIRRRRPDLPIAVVPSPLSLPPPFDDGVDQSVVRADLGLEGHLVIGSFGYITSAKRLDVALRAFRELRQAHPEAIYLLVGGVMPEYDLAGLIHRLDLADAVRCTDRVDLDTFLRYMVATDVAINLRYPTAGETSASLIRLLGLGTATIVSDVGAFSEWPDDVCAKVPVDSFEEDTLVALLGALARDKALRRTMAGNARRYTRAHHAIQDTTRAYLTFIEQVVSGTAREQGKMENGKGRGEGGKGKRGKGKKGKRKMERGKWKGERGESSLQSPSEGLLSEIAGTLAGWGVTEHDDALLQPVAQAMAEIGLPFGESR